MESYGVPWDRNVTDAPGVPPAGTFPAWGQYRSDQKTAGYTTTIPFSPPNGGSGSSVWVLDTGIRTTHEQFGGRAFFAISYISGQTNDGNGHGTHCAVTVGGAWQGSPSAGYSYQCSLYAVKVLSDQGSGATSGIISGIDYVINNRKAGQNIISMSLGGGQSLTLNDACNRAAVAGVLVAAAAGNSNTNAANTSPCSAKDSICVAATDSTNALASYSNYGTIVDIAAPGSNIPSAWYTSDTAYNTISGTSMATPAIAGQLGIYSVLFGAGRTTAQVRTDIANFATKNAITNYGSKPLLGNWIGYDRWNR